MPERDANQGPFIPHVTVVVPVYNGARVIRDCVASLLALTYPRDRCEIVVVDNGSTDGTLRIIAGIDGRLRVLSEPLRGAAAARNRGIREARGQVLAFTDADATVDPGWLTALVTPLVDRSVGIVGGRIRSRLPANRVERFGEVIHDQRAAIEQATPPYVCSGNWASRREVLYEVGLFDPALRRGEDVDLAWRVHAAGYRLVYRDDASVFHRNERTLRGLMAEGFDHGVTGVRVRERHLALLGERGGARRRSHVNRRIVDHVMRVARGPDRLDATLPLLFDLGKAAGELVAVAGRRPRAIAPAAAPRPAGTAR